MIPAIDTDTEAGVPCPLYAAGTGPIWTSRETFEKFIEDQESDADAVRLKSQGIIATPAALRDHIFGLFCGEHALPRILLGSNNVIRSSADGAFEFIYSNYHRDEIIPADFDPRRVQLCLVDRLGIGGPTEWRWRTYAYGMPGGLATTHWLLPSELPRLRALIREYFPELN